MIPIDQWKPADNLTLEPNAQRAATELSQCLALTAGPGAGKTEMLAQRADFVLQTGTCRYPKRILAISFKVDASKNLKDRVRNRCGISLASRFDSYTFHAFAKRIIDRFRRVLRGDDFLNDDYKIGDRKIRGEQIRFEDLVPLATKILDSSAIARNAVRQTYSDVFLDEFQDCTKQQYQLVRIAFMGTPIRVTAVGDVKQKIMGWAGALEGIFQTFATDFNAMPLNMYRNFRSAPLLLRMQNEIIKVLDPASVMPDHQLTGTGGEVFAVQLEDSHKEAEYLAETIADWVNKDQLPLSEIAVLVSKQLDLYANHLMVQLEARGIPFRNEHQMQDITAEPAARLVVDYLSCLYGQREPKAWVRLVKQLMPFEEDESLSSARQDLDRLIKRQRRDISAKASDGSSHHGWWDSVRTFLQHVGIETLTALSPDYESVDRLKAILRDTKKHIEELLRIEPVLPKALERFADDQAVRILTIHKSKGLEFDSVIIMAVENEIFFGNQDENRCAFFVGVSRAKKRLVLTCADYRERPDDYKGRWDENRSPQSEYFGYSAPFV